MDPVTIPYHLLIPAVLSFALFLWIATKNKKLINEPFDKWFWISCSVFLLTYSFYTGLTTYHDIQYQVELNSYDLNQNGLFEQNEITPEQELAMTKLTSDVGRNFSIFFGLIPSLIFSVPVYVVGLVIEGRKNRA